VSEASDGGPRRVRPGKPPARTRGRRKAVNVLFEADQRGVDAVALAGERLVGDGPALGYARVLVEGVAAHRDEIDESLETYSLGWPLARMPAVDRAIARLGAYEILFESEVPTPVVLAQAADLASLLSTAKSADFLSGLLGRIGAMASG
jgi:N utilization substance protein B